MGSAVAFELAASGARTLVVEAESEPAAGASRSNSGIIHTGFDSIPGTLETKLILEQSRRWRPLFDALGVPYSVPGAMLVATDEEEVASLPALAENAERNGVETRMLDEAEAGELEPGASALAALLIPGEAITDPYEVVRRLLAAGPELRLSWPVRQIRASGSATVVSGPRGEVSGSFVVACGGLYGDTLSDDDEFRISARRGEFMVFPRGSSEFVRHILLPVPSKRTKGVLVFPTLHGHLCAGPSAVDQDDKEDWRPRRELLAEVRISAARIFPKVGELDCVDSWAGLRPTGHPRNYILEWSRKNPCLLNVAAIRSTGLSACLGISRYVLGMLSERGLPIQKPGSMPDRVVDEQFLPWWQRLNRLRGVEGPC